MPITRVQDAPPPWALPSGLCLGWPRAGRLDWVGLTGFFGCGFFPQDRTFYDDVRILRPATHYVFNGKGEELSARRYWEWQHEPDYERSYEDTVGQFGGLFQSVMANLLQPCAFRIALPISGGLDSRSTVAAIARPTDHGPRATDRLWSYSYGYSDDSVETRIARQVAEARELPFKAFTIKPYLFDRIDQVLAAVEGFQDITQCRQAFVADELGEHADFVIAAHWGDVWLDDMGLVQSGSLKAESGKVKSDQVTEHALKKMAKRGRAWLLQNLCAPHLGKERPEDLLRQFVVEGMKPLQPIADPDFRVKAFKTDQWSFRWTLASLRMFQAAAFPLLPFYDTRLADFFCGVPSEYVAGRRLQVDYLKRFAPELASIEWQAYGANLYDYQRCAAWSLPRRAVKKALRLATGKKIIERNWEVQFGGRQGEEGLKHWLLRPNLRLHDLISRQDIEALLSDFRASPLKDGRGYTISMLLTFSAWLEHSRG